MIKTVYTFLGISILMFQAQCQSSPSMVNQANTLDELSEKAKTDLANLSSYRGIKILDVGPTGRRHHNSKRGEFGCTKFRITIYNDTIIPIELKVDFPAHQVTSLPDPLMKDQYWVLPESMTPDSFRNARDFGIIGLEEHFNTDDTDSRIVKTTIQPKQQYTFYMAGMGESPFERGSSFGKLYINGQDVDIPYIKGKTIKPVNPQENTLDLVWGIGHTPHNLYTLISCGQIKYLN